MQAPGRARASVVTSVPAGCMWGWLLLWFLVCEASWAVACLVPGSSVVTPGHQLGMAEGSLLSPRVLNDYG